MDDFIKMKCKNVRDTTLCETMMAVCLKSLRCRTVYAGLIVFFVPFVICESVDRSKYLTYDDSIFNHTKYPQLQSKRPYQPLNISQLRPNKGNYGSRHRNKLEDGISSENELEYEELEFNKHNNKKLNSNDLLVGFSYDPYRFSVPEKEFVKGVRNYQPSDNMMKNEYRGKRGVAHLYNMIYCATGCEPLIYKGYGCYCGFLGAGRTTDGIDRCCKMHDQCYENLYCPFFTVYFQPYYWKCYHGEPLCALENYKTRNQLINGCAGRLCECDRELAMCLRRYSCPRRRALCRSSPIRLLQNVLMLR